MNRGFASVAIIIALVAIVAGAGWWYMNKSSVPVTSETTQLPMTQQNTNTGMQPTVNNQPSQPAQTSLVPSTPSAAATANWKTYTNTTYGYHIKYPTDWKASSYGTISNGKDQEIWITHQTTSGQVDKKIVILANVDIDGNLPYLRTAPTTVQASIAGVEQTVYVFPMQNGCTNGGEQSSAYWCSHLAVPINHDGVWYELTASYGADAYAGTYKDIFSTFGF